MDDLDANLLLCKACGRDFAHMNAYSNHFSSCRQGKRKMASALGSARESYRIKRSRLQTTSSSAPYWGEITSEGDGQPPTPPASSAADATVTPIEPPVTLEVTAVSDAPATVVVPRPQRQNRQLPKRFRVDQPAPPAILLPIASPLDARVQESSSPSANALAVAPLRRLLNSPVNRFGLFRQYLSLSFPAHDPESNLQATDLSDVAADHEDDAVTPASTFYPYPNQNTFLLGEWYWGNGAQKTKDDFQQLVNIITGDGFNPADIRNIAWDSVNKFLGGSGDSESNIWLDEPDAGWKATAITLSIPFRQKKPEPGKQKRTSRGTKKRTPTKLLPYTFPPFRHRSIVAVLKEKMANLHDFQHFHLEPYELQWRRSKNPAAGSTRVYGELYTSPAFIEAHEEIQALAGEPGCLLPRVLVGLMFGSDSTHLTSFGSASLWPCYMYFGNESKYRRCKPTCHLCNHMAYFQKLPPEFQDFIALNSVGHGSTEALMTHCRRDFFHAQWREILDDEFLEAYEHGVVIACCDGIMRRFYLRIFAYSADYPEKTLLTSIRNMGKCPCPRCLTPKYLLDQLGTALDINRRARLIRVDHAQYRSKISSARDIIYKQNRPVNSKFVNAILEDESLVPTENAFSHRLSALGFNLFSVFLVDLMHEFELGVWKRIFIHLLRILECVKGATNQLNQRFRAMPTFGRDSIRRFSNNVSELKKLGARDYENLLQCSIPAFEGLLPDKHDNILKDLLFVLAHWHALAKLRQHTELTLNVLESVTVQLGKLLKIFEATTCSAFETHELDREEKARTRRRAEGALSSSKRTKRASDAHSDGNAVSSKDVAEGNLATSSSGSSHVSERTNQESKKSGGKQRKTLNLKTYKNHSLGDYVETIRRFGTTDSYSTETMELEHRSPKSRYLRTSRKEFEIQLGGIERRLARIRRIRQKLSSSTHATLAHENGPESSACDYHIGKTQNYPVDLGAFALDNRNDPAVQNFTENLKIHLLPRVQKRLQISPETFESNTTATALHDKILIKDNRVYNHKLARFYHTTYDIRRSEDIINPKTPHCNIMLLANFDLEPHANGPGSRSLDGEAPHHFLYGRVIGIYHANIVYIGPGMKGYEVIRFDFLHVRWYQRDIAQSRGQNHCGWGSLRLDRLGFSPMTTNGSFSFVDPGLVMRGCHLIPAFSFGRVYSDGIGLSKLSNDAKDWRYYYVNRFADRDITMRYHWGMGIGHTYSHDQLDVQLQRFSEFSPPTDDSPEDTPVHETTTTPASEHVTAATANGDLNEASESEDEDSEGHNSEGEGSGGDDETGDSDDRDSESAESDDDLEEYDTYHRHK